MVTVPEHCLTFAKGTSGLGTSYLHTSMCSTPFDYTAHAGCISCTYSNVEAGVQQCTCQMLLSCTAHKPAYSVLSTARSALVGVQHFLMQAAAPSSVNKTRYACTMYIMHEPLARWINVLQLQAFRSRDDECDGAALR